MPLSSNAIRMKKRTIQTVARARVRLVITAIIAFALGAGVMWLGQRKTELLPPQVPATAAAAAPDVSQLGAADAALTLANWNYDRQNWSHALEHYQQAIAAGRDNPDVLTDLGNCFRFLNQPQKALEQYENAQRLNPQHENSLYNQAGLFAEVLHDPERAKELAREFIARFPKSPRAESARRFINQLDTGPQTDRQRIEDWMSTRK
jgi:tetratricopeptide (TPR) repeat protein